MTYGKNYLSDLSYCCIYFN